MNNNVKIGIYKHYKGSRVEVIGVALHSETKEELVTYYHRDAVLGLPENSLWVRPKEMFLEEVIVEGKTMPRFEFLYGPTEVVKIGVNTAVFNEKGEMLLETRAKDGTIGVPGGWVDEGENCEDAAKREMFEETALTVEIGELVEIFYREKGKHGSRHRTMHFLYSAEVVSGTIQISHESLDMKFMDHTQVTNWHRDHQQFAEAAFNHWKSKQ